MRDFYACSGYLQQIGDNHAANPGVRVASRRSRCRHAVMPSCNARYSRAFIRVDISRGRGVCRRAFRLLQRRDRGERHRTRLREPVAYADRQHHDHDRHVDTRGHGSQVHHRYFRLIGRANLPRGRDRQHATRRAGGDRSVVAAKRLERPSVWRGFGRLRRRDPVQRNCVSAPRAGSSRREPTPDTSLPRRSRG